MGRSSGPSASITEAALGLASGRPAGAMLLAAALLCATSLAGSLHAQTLNDRLSRMARSDSSQTDRMLVDAAEMIYDRNANTITARGSVQIYYQGRILEADRVVYNQTTKRLFAEGNAKLTERDGSVAYSTRFELSDDFRDGFVDSLRAETADRTRFTAARAERIGGETTVFMDGTYTACAECKDDPSKPPLWRVRAKKIIHNNSEQTVYYEDATFELLGVPIAWLPYFSTPDPSVERKSGVLAPRYLARSQLGAGVSVPLYWALSPNYDLTVTPTYLSRQGFLGSAEWRHRLLDGSYTIRASGIFQEDPGAFLAPPYGPGAEKFRGAVESQGLFRINDKWKFGWDGTFMTDRWFMQDYKLPNQILSQNYFKESISTVFMTGQGPRGFFDMRAYHIRGLTRGDLQEQQPLVAPLVDYNKTFNLPKSQTAGIGGQVELDFNFTNISRDLASVEAIGGRRLDTVYGLYDVCARDGGTGRYSSADCLVRGVAGNYARATAQANWRRQFIDPLGQVWTPFTFVHMQGSWLRLDETGSVSWKGDCLDPLYCIRNSDQLGIFGQQDNIFRGQVTPGAGVEYRFPLMARTQGVTHVIEPIAQIVARPGVMRSRTLVNEDAQSLVFDDTTLFQWSKFSGYDRYEGGTRLNYGAQYTATFDTGGYANVTFGQSYHLAGPNSYASPDAANVGLSSGLDTPRSDYIARVAYAPNATYNFVAKGRFDVDTFDMRRFDIAANANFGRFETSLIYARYDAQEKIGYDKTRQGLGAASKLKLTNNYFVNGAVVFDMSRHLYKPPHDAPEKSAPLFSLAGLGIGAGYTDDCTTLAVNYTSVLQENTSGLQTRNHTISLQLELRTLGDARVRSGLGGALMQDGLSSSNAR